MNVTLGQFVALCCHWLLEVERNRLLACGLSEKVMRWYVVSEN
jgi:hypothetical protein